MVSQVQPLGNFVRGFHVLAAAFITLAGWGVKMARQHVTASVVVPLYLGPRPFPETRFCQAEIHIEESQGGGSGPIGLVKLPSYKEMCRQHKVMFTMCSSAICVCTKSLQQQILRIMLMAGSSIGVPCYADMFVARGRARLKARDGKVFELDGLLASIARNRSQFAYFLVWICLGSTSMWQTHWQVTSRGATSSLNQGKQSHRRMAIHTGKPWFIFMAWEVRPQGMLEKISRWEESGGKWVWFKKSAWLKCWFSHWRRTLLWKHIGSGVDYLQADSELLWPWRLGASYAPGLRAVFPSAPLLQQPWGETLGSWSLGQWTNMVWWPDGLSLPFSKSKPWRRQVSICWYH